MLQKKKILEQRRPRTYIPSTKFLSSEVFHDPRLLGNENTPRPALWEGELHYSELEKTLWQTTVKAAFAGRAYAATDCPYAWSGKLGASFRSLLFFGMDARAVKRHMNKRQASGSVRTFEARVQSKDVHILLSFCLSSFGIRRGHRTRALSQVPGEVLRLGPEPLPGGGGRGDGRGLLAHHLQRGPLRADPGVRLDPGV